MQSMRLGLRLSQPCLDSQEQVDKVNTGRLRKFSQ